MGADSVERAANKPNSAEAQDLRCGNPDCDLYELKPEPDEVAPEPGDTPDRCAACGRELAPYQAG